MNLIFCKILWLLILHTFLLRVWHLLDDDTDTSNIYEVEPEKYEKMLKENITSNYRKDNENTKDKMGQNLF